MQKLARPMGYSSEPVELTIFELECFFQIEGFINCLYH